MPRRGPDADRPEANSRVPLKSRIFSLLLLAAALAACSDEQTGDVQTLDARGGSARKTLTASTNDETYFLLPFSAPSGTPSGSGAYGLDLTGVNVPPASNISLRSVQRLRTRLDSETKRYEALQPRLTAARDRLKRDPEYFRSAYQRLRLRSAATPPPTLDIYSHFSGEEGTQITGTRRALSSDLAIYVDNRANGSVSNEQVQEILAAYDDISLPRLHALFGHESDVDNNSVVIVFLASVDQMGTQDLGFFYPIDLLPDGTQGANSNEAEIVYVRTPDLDNPIELVHATMAHETTHLINFGLKSLPAFQQGGSVSLENLPLAEGIAHLAEELTGWSVDTPLITSIYLDCLPYTSLFGEGENSVPSNTDCQLVGSNDDSFPRRGGMMLFLLYLFQQLGGATYSASDAGALSGEGIAFLQRLVSSQAVGIANIESSSDRGLFSWYADFAAMLALDNTGSTSDTRYNLNEEVTDSFTDFIRNVRIRGDRLDLDGSTIPLDGPFLSQDLVTTSASVNGSLFVSGLNALRVTVPANTEMTISVTANPSLSLGLSLVRVP